MYLDYNIGAFRMSMNGEYPFKWTLKLLSNELVLWKIVIQERHKSIT